MRSHFALRRLRHASISLPTRTLTTYPRKIPSYASVWNPSASTQSAQQETAVRPDEDDAPTNDPPDARHIATQLKRARILDYEIGRNYAIQRLLRCVALFQRPTPPSERRWHLWRAYSLAKKTDPKLLKQLPPLAWTTLWNSQSIKHRSNRFARAHVVELYRDMEAVGIAATVDQKIAYIESLFLNGQKNQAFRWWDKNYLVSEDAPEFLESGIRMYGLFGDAVRAHEIMDTLFELYPLRNPDVMKAVFRAYMRSDETEHHDTAHGIYLEAKGRQDYPMTQRDYDCFFVGFLEAKSLPRAKQVFKDMVVHTNIGLDDSQEAIDQVLRRLRMLHGLADDIVQITSVSLQAISILPPAYHSHLFGDWMKLAVAHKAPAVMAQILDMMFTRGCPPDTYHFNIWLRTMFRSDERRHVLQAENVGWQMMNEAAKGLPTRSSYKSAAEAVSRTRRTQAAPPGDPSLPRQVPPADASTIALLMWHHLGSSGWEHINYLSKQMENLRIPPNEHIMNVQMDFECRKGHYNKVWDVYKHFTDPSNDSKGVFPNGSTFRYLWKSMRLCLGDYITRKKSTLPTPRDLLAEQLRWWHLARRRPDADRFKIGLATAENVAIYKLVMHCFSYANDLPGTLVAMHALRQNFGVFPSSSAQQILQNQIAWVDTFGLSKEVRDRHAHTGIPRKIFEQMGQIYHVLMHGRFRHMRMTEDDFARLSEKEKGDLELNMLSEFIRVILKRRCSPEDVEALISQAKEDIGIPDISTGDKDAFDVA